MMLPWMAARIQLRPVTELRAHPGNARVHGAAQIEQIKASMLAFDFTNPLLVDEAGVLIAGHGRLEAATATFALIAQGSTRGTASVGGAPTTATYTAFHKAQGNITQGGSPLAQVTSAQLTYANGLEAVRTIRPDRKLEGVDPGIARATGQITACFADTVLLSQAGSGMPIDLAFGYAIDANRGLTIAPHEVYLSGGKTPISGPAGVEATFDFRAAFNATAGCMMTVELRNQQAVSEYT